MLKNNKINENNSCEQWDLIIEPKRKWWDLQINQLYKYKDLIFLLVWRDFVSTYKQTILGPLWYLIQPILTTYVFTIIFGNIANIPTDDIPPFLFYMSGTVIWAYFSDCLKKTSNTFIENANLFGKVYFPRLIVPIANIISNLVTFLIQLLLFLSFLLFFITRGLRTNINLSILLLPFLIVIMAGMGLGFGIIISSLTTKYRDLRYLVGFGTQLWMYATPVIYPSSSVPSQWQWIIKINPLTPIVEIFRSIFLNTELLNYTGIGYSFLCMIFVLFIGLLIFNQVESIFMDTV